MEAVALIRKVIHVEFCYYWLVSVHCNEYSELMTRHNEVVLNFYSIWMSLDINECASSKRPCHEQANCVNTKGSYECNCKSGYSGDGRLCTRKFTKNIFSFRFAKMLKVL